MVDSAAPSAVGVHAEICDVGECLRVHQADSLTAAECRRTAHNIATFDQDIGLPYPPPQSPSDDCDCPPAGVSNPTPIATVFKPSSSNSTSKSKLLPNVLRKLRPSKAATGDVNSAELTASDADSGRQPSAAAMIQMREVRKDDELSSGETPQRSAKVLAERTFSLEQLSTERYEQMFDRERRLISEHEFRQAVFKGGLEESLRREAWCFLFGVYPYHSTEKERLTIRTQCLCRYKAVRLRWKQQLLKLVPDFDLDNYANFLMDEDDKKPMFATDRSPVDQLEKELGDSDTTTDYIQIGAKIYAARFACTMDTVTEALRFVSKDVPRTDRMHPYFVGDNNVHLMALRDALVTFAVLHPDIGYVQGMNDLMARFLIVFNDEAMAFWCFAYFIVTVQKDFLAEGMLQRIITLKGLLEEVDPDLHHYLHVCEAADMVFCHKWLLLSFQREFAMEDGLRLLEILSSHHVELSSLHGQTAVETYKQTLLQINGLNMAPTETTEYSFDLFVAASILVLNRDRIFQCVDGSQIHQFVCRLSQQLDLDEILMKAERLFYNFCKKSVADAFVLVE